MTTGGLTVHISNSDNSDYLQQTRAKNAVIGRLSQGQKNRFGAAQINVCHCCSGIHTPRTPGYYNTKAMTLSTQFIGFSVNKLQHFYPFCLKLLIISAFFEKTIDTENK